VKFGKGHHLLLVDGSAYVFRAHFSAVRNLPRANQRRSDGAPVGALHFFCNMLLGDVLNSNLEPTHAAIVFDASAKTFRNELYPAYKANRPPPPKDLVPQFASVREATRAFNLPCLELEGFEADDIIATLAGRASAAGAEVTILASDKDLMQLVGDGVTMQDPMKRIRIGRDQVVKKFGVPPELVTDVQALIGDSTDNIPGAPGIGIKTAPGLIKEYGDLDSLLARADEIKQKRRRETLMNFADQILLSRRLATLDRKVPMDVELGSLALKPPEAKPLLDFLVKQEFRTVVRRVAGYLGVKAPPVVPLKDRQQDGAEARTVPFDRSSYECVTDAEALERWLGEAVDQGFFAIDTETTSLDEMHAELVGISIATKPGRACYVPLAHEPENASLLEKPRKVERQLEMQHVLDLLRPVLEASSVLKIGHNIKFDMKIFARYGMVVRSVDDTLLLSFALHGGRHNHGMDVLSSKYLGHEPLSIKELVGPRAEAKTFAGVPIAKAVEYAAEDADVTLRLWHKFKPLLHRSRVTTVYEVLDRPLIAVLLQMERNGIRVDAGILNRMSDTFAEQLARLERRIHELAGTEFNVASPKQLGEVLFDRLGLPSSKARTRRGYTTSAPILQDLAAEGNELPSLVLDWRHLAKLKSTYTDTLQQCISPETGRVHTSYSIAGAQTGRLASSDPNLQNIPVRSEEGRPIRESFIAEEGNVLVSLDYSQIELRILAGIAQVDTLRQAFAEGKDIHAMTASQVFEVPIEDMDPHVRRRAKAINFGIIYGQTAFGLARSLRIPRSAAKEFIDTYFERFPGILAYKNSTVAFARKNRYVETLFGRRIHTPNIGSSGPSGQFAARSAINAPIQGTAADVIRRAMIRIPDEISEMPARMLLQVHDELLFEVREDFADELIGTVKQIMETADMPMLALDPGLVVDVGKGRSWAQAH